MKRLLLVLTVCAFLLSSAPLFATPMVTALDFFGVTAANTGVITVTGNNVVATNISVQSLRVDFADGSTAIWNIDSGLLNLNTAQDFIRITGEITGPPDSQAGAGPFPILDVTPIQMLLDGTFSSWEVANGIIHAMGPDIKSSELLTQLGMNPDTPFRFFGSVTGVAIPDVTGSYRANSLDVSNTPVPEPGSLLLIGSGLLLAFGIARKRAK